MSPAAPTAGSLEESAETRPEILDWSIAAVADIDAFVTLPAVGARASVRRLSVATTSAVPFPDHPAVSVWRLQSPNGGCSLQTETAVSVSGSRLTSIRRLQSHLRDCRVV